MLFRKKYILVAIFFLFLCTLAEYCDLSYAASSDFPKQISEIRDIPDVNLPPLIFPLSITTSMTGTIKLIKPGGGIEQTISLGQYAQGGYTTQANLSQVGIYTIEESYSLTMNSALLGINSNNQAARSSSYNNTSPGTKTLRLSKSTVSGLSVSLPAQKFAVNSIEPTSIEPSQNIVVTVTIKDADLPVGAKATIVATWNANVLDISAGTSNIPPSVSIVSAAQSQANGDVLISYTLISGEQRNCSISVQYSKDGSSWSSATVTGSTTGVAPGSRTISWKSAQDQPSGQGTYYLRMKANDGIADGNWSASKTLTLNNNAAGNQPPGVTNPNIETIDAVTGQKPVPYRVPRTGDKLKAAYTYTDPDGDTEKNSMIAWYKNNVKVKESTIEAPQDPDLILSQTVNRGENWYFVITPSDGKVSGQPRNSITVSVANAPPTANNAQIQPSSPTSDKDLKAVYSYSDPENDAQGLPQIRWYKNNVLQPQYNDKVTVLAKDTNRNDRWYFTVLPKDSLGAASDKEPLKSSTVTIANQKPAVEIVSVTGTPGSASGSISGKLNITFDLTDQDGDTCTLKVAYRIGTASFANLAKNIKGITTNVPPAAGLTLVWESDMDQPAKYGDYRLVIQANDGVDSGEDAVSKSFLLDNNESPVASGASVSPKSPFSSDTLKADYKFEDLDNGDAESGSRIRWYKNKIEQTNYRDKKEVAGSATKRDEEWYFTVEPSDGKEFGNIEQSNSVKITNSPPVAVDVKLLPESPTAEDDLKASYKYSDADEDPESDTQIRWYVNGSLLSEYNDKDTVQSSAIAKGQTWFFTVLLNDGTDSSKLVESNHAKIGNVTPSIKSLIVPSEGYKDVKINFELVDTDNDKCSLTVEYRGGMVSNWAPVSIREALTGLSPGQITLTWDSAKDQDVRQSTMFQIRITPNDGTVSGTAVESEFIKLDNNVPPIASNLRISPANPTTADNLEAFYDYSDPDGGIESGSEVKWYKNGKMMDFTGKVLSASSTQKGEKWHFTVKPRDGAKFGDIVISAPVTILNSPPSLKKVEILPASPKSDDTLTARYDYRDIDEDKESGTEIEWYKDGISQLKKVVASEDDKKIAGLSKGEKWYVTVKPKDGNDFGEPITSATITVSNAIPSIKNINISGNSDDVTIAYSLLDGDSDACSINIEYQGGSVKTAWTKATVKGNLAEIPPGDNKFVWDSKADEKGFKADDYRIRITPDDGIQKGEGSVSLKFSLNNNTLPSATNLAIFPEIPTTTSEMKASYTFLDSDGDQEAKSEIIWYKNGVSEIIYDNFTTLPSNATSKGDRWYYTIRVYDGKDYGKLQLSPSVVIANDPPSANNVVLSPNFPKLEDRLIASYSYADADKDLEQGTTIEWYKDDVKQEAYNDSLSVSGSATQPGEEWYFTVTPKDGYSFGTPQSSNAVFIANLPPSASSLGILPVNPMTTDDLVASYIYMDPENDPENGSKITWYRNSVSQTKYNDTLRLPSDATSRSQVWHFTVTPKDGKQYGDIRQSSFVIIGNTPPRAENLSISPAYPLKNDDLAISYNFIDFDGDIEGRSEIKWYKNSSWMSKYDGLRKLPSKETQNREIWYFTIRPKDDTDFGQLYTSPSVEIGSPVPRVNNLVIKPESPLTTNELSVDYIFTDPYGLTESGSQITWYKNGTAQTEYNNLRILPSSATSKDEQWYFTVKPSNGSISGEVQKSAIVTIANSAPKLRALAIEPSKPSTDDTMVVSYVFEDPDGDTEARNEIKWYKNGILQTEYEGKNEILAENTNRNEEWYFTVRSSDGSSFSALATSPTVKIGNGKPRVSNISIIPSSPKTEDDLMVIYDYSDTEKDVESGTEIEWFNNNVQQPDYHNLRSVPSSATARDEKWYCVITPRDGIDFGSQAKSPIVNIGNTKPEVVSIETPINQVNRGKSITIIAQGKDADSVDSADSLKCEVSYRVGNSEWTELSSEYVASQQYKAIFSPDAKFALGEYDFRARFIDSAGAESDWVYKNKMVSVLNSPPVIDISTDNFTVLEDNIREFDLGSYGSDFESESNLTWRIDPGSINKDLFEASIVRNKILEIKPLDNKNGKDDITLILTDPDNTSVEKTDVTIIVDPVNDPPTIPTMVRITPEPPKTLDTLVCEASGSSDLDKDSVVYRYQWYRNGVKESDLKSKDVHYSRTSKGEVWKCEVTPSDGSIDGPMLSAEVTIADTLPVVSNVLVTGSSKDIGISFDLEDADDDSCDLKLEYKVKDKNWKTATIDGSTSAVKPAKGLSLIWQSNKDEANLMTDECRLRITPGNGSLKESSSFNLDNKPPEFSVFIIVNPVYEYYVDVSIISDEKLTGDLPEVSVVIGEGDSTEYYEPSSLKMDKIAQNTWKGSLQLKPGFVGDVTIRVKGTDLLGNASDIKRQQNFVIPSPEAKPSEYALRQNYPNPVVNDTRIPYQLVESSNVTIKIYDVTGRLVRILEEGYRVAGFYVIKDKAAYWDGKDDNGSSVSTGVYFYHLRADNFEKVKKMAVLR